jgi:hypothetical protein
MTRMFRKLSVMVLAAALTTAACGTNPQSGPWVTPPSGPPSVAGTPSATAKPSTAAAPQPTFTDPLHGNTTSVVKLYSYDAVAHSAVVEPIVFLDGTAYCQKFKIKSKDPQCQREWISKESHVKITVPVVSKPRLNAWDDGNGGDCFGDIVTGSVCAVSAATFAGWLKENPEGFAVITTKGGTITKIAQMYTP